MFRAVLTVSIVLLLYAALVAQTLSTLAPTVPDEQSAKLKPDAHDGDLIESVKKGDLAAVLRLLDSGASPDATDDEGSSALCWAVRINRADIAEVLLARKAKADQTEDDGRTALQVAAAAGHANLVKLLIAHGAKVNLKDDGGHTALMCAAFGVVLKSAPDWLARSFFDFEGEDEELLASIGDEHLAVVKILLAAGADVNAQGEDCGLSSLMIAAMSGNVQLGKILLEHGADVNARSGELTALKFAEMGEAPEDLQEMLDGETDTERRQTILNWLQFTRSGRRQFAALLRKSGAN